MPTPDQIKLIHTLKGALALDADTYRAALAGYGAESSKDLTERKAKQFIDDLESKAIAAGVWKRKRSDFNGADALTLKIRALWAELYKAGKVEVNTDKALNSYVKRMTDINHIRWCSTAQKITLIEALKKWLARDGK